MDRDFLIYASTLTPAGRRSFFARVKEGVDTKDRERVRETARRVADICRVKGISLITRVDEGYPSSLFDLTDPPPVIYFTGHLSVLDRFSGAVIGSRNPSGPGIEFTERIVSDLVRSGCPIVSGFARGIDQAAHRAALDAGGETVAVMGSGVDVIYPSGSESLARRITEKGCLLSEFPPGTPPLRHHFPQRNRIIAALSRFVCVMEAAEKSGTLITVRYALDLGREVFAVPGHPLYPRSKGCNLLIKEGAIPLTSADDVLETFGFTSLRGRGEERVRTSEGIAEGKEMLSLLENPLSPDEICARAGISVSEALAQLHLLEMEGLVRRMNDGRFVRALE